MNLMKNIIIIMFYLTSTLIVAAQDIIVFRNGDEIKAVIKKVSVATIEYKKYDNTEGPVYEENKDNIFMIKYKNGNADYFEVSDENKSNKKNFNHGVFIDERDNTTYKFVKIGEQIWMSENLRYDDGRSPFSPNDSDSCDACGRYYKYEDAIKACPKGWHLPTDNEWMDLEIEVGMRAAEAGKYGWRGTSPGQAQLLTIGGKTGLDLRMCGYITHGNLSKKNPWVNNNLKNKEAFYWTATPDQDHKFFIAIRHFKGRASIDRSGKTRKAHFPVRCIKDN